jgi:hypothetical protein
MTAKQKAARARFKEVQADAKKLRKKNPNLTQADAVKQAWAIYYNKKGSSLKGYEKTTRRGNITNVTYTTKTKKKAAKKSTKVTQGKLFGATKHKDTKSHNVNIKVVSGIGSYNEPEKILLDIEYWQKQLDKLRNEYKSEKGKLYKHSIMSDIRMAKKWLELRKKALKIAISKIK